ncbi:MAG TPA: hypothetical protein VHT03_14515 [Rhizomicrobium sp.]|nr:hypothetical protein [Rhizomicrobium sp.]
MSGIAVAVTLVFLVIQIRQTNRNQRSLMQQGHLTMLVDASMRWAEPIMQDLIVRAEACDTTMEPSQIGTFLIMMQAALRNFEDGYLQFKSGTLGAASLASDVAMVRVHFAAPAYRAAWRVLRNRFGADFRAYMDAFLREIKVETSFDPMSQWKSFVAEELAAAPSP